MPVHQCSDCSMPPAGKIRAIEYSAYGSSPTGMAKSKM